MSETEYRYVAARGVEYRDEGWMTWARVPAKMLAALPATDLRKIAKAMDGEPDTFDGTSYTDRIRDLEAQLADARSEAVALRATEENLRRELADMTKAAVDVESAARTYRKSADDLRAQLAARTGASPATPLGWVNVYGDRVIDVYFHHSEKAARNNADGSDKVKRTAVPVYEHPPRPVAPVTDAEILEALRAGWREASRNAAGRDICEEQVTRVRALLDRAAVAPVSDDELMTAMGEGIHYEDGVTVGYDLTESLAALKKLLNRAAVAPDYQLVGACVVRPDNIVAVSWTSGAGWSIDNAIKHAAQYGGTPYRLYRGEPITEATP